jgi:hypothetical protein
LGILKGKPITFEQFTQLEAQRKAQPWTLLTIPLMPQWKKKKNFN